MWATLGTPNTTATFIMTFAIAMVIMIMVNSDDMYTLGEVKKFSDHLTVKWSKFLSSVELYLGSSISVDAWAKDGPDSLTIGFSRCC